MTPDETRAYLELTYRKAPEGSARWLWAKAQLAKLTPQRPTDQPTGKPVRKGARS